MIEQQHRNDFASDGYAIVRSLFSPNEAGILLDHAARSSRIRERVMSMPDGDGRQSKLTLWTERVDDVFGAVSRSPRVVDGARRLLGEDVYHWHSKVMLKEPRTGGAWEWHQDYGYWYNDGCLYPRLISCLIALDRADRANGCLKVLAGSHHLGRIDHGGVGSQAGANRERVAEAERQLSVRYAELDPGDAIFFHCNLLHASEPNPSDRPRTSVICCYNAWSNRPAAGQGHGKPEPIELDTVGIERFATV
ncbi:MAG: phytanoyl-CoA dioxygenase family protein [Planctomycetes bacterium]|nr:phytanoyl-CoA dioxygenase family protein [Planctomycetota bacterium]